MKIYVATLMLSEEEYKSINGVLDYSLADYMSDHWRYLYGFTDNKKLFKKFCSYHKGLKIKTVKMSKEEYADFRKENKSSEISIYPFICGIKEDLHDDSLDKIEVMIPCSKNEYVISVNYASEFYYNDIASLAKVDPKIFKDEYIDLLQYIDYVDCWMHLNAEPDELEEYLYNKSFYLTYIGRFVYSSKEFIDEDTKYNHLGIFITSFSYVINAEKLYEYLLERSTEDE